MVLIEFRIPLPLAVEEFQIAQLFMVIRASAENTKGGEGVVWLKNEPYDNTDGHMGVSAISGTPVPRTKGQYTLKEYHLASRVPGIVRTLLPSSSMVLVEEAWNAYPHCKTVLVNAYLDKHKFKIDIESLHLPDNGTTHNALNLTDAELKERQVETLDICEAYHDKSAKDYRADYDSSLFRSEKTARGPLRKGWQASAAPVMTCYKVCRLDFKYWGMQTKVESTIEKQQRELFNKSLSAAFCMIDQWHGLTMEDIRRMEAKSAEELKIEAAHAHDHGHGHGHGHEHHHEDKASDAAKAAGAPS